MSKQSSEVINLGKKIAEEFSGHRESITAKWMSHYLSELIAKAENESDPAKKNKLELECVDFILRLWSNRKNFPYGTAPLSNLAATLDVLKALGEDREIHQPLWRNFDRYDDGSPWGNYIRKLRENFEDSFSLVLCATVAIQVLEKEKEWLGHENLLSSDEKLILKQLDRLLNKGTGPFRVVYITSDPKALDPNATEDDTPISKIDEVLEKLSAILRSQQKELEKLRAQVVKDEKD